MERDLEIREFGSNLLARDRVEVSQQTAAHGLVAHDQHVLQPLKLQDERLQAHHNVVVALSAGIAEEELVLLACVVCLRVLLLDLFVGQAVAIASIKLVQALEALMGKYRPKLAGLLECMQGWAGQNTLTSTCSKCSAV